MRLKIKKNKMNGAGKVILNMFKLCDNKCIFEEITFTQRLELKSSKT